MEESALRNFAISQKNNFFTEHLQTTAYGFVLINFSFQGNFTGQKISSNTLMLRI